MSLPLSHRLLLRTERERVEKEGTSISSSLLTIIRAPLPSSVTAPRFAVLVSKRVSPHATTRNKIRRRILGAIKSVLHLTPPADYFIIARGQTREASFENLKSTLTSLLAK